MFASRKLRKGQVHPFLHNSRRFFQNESLFPLSNKGTLSFQAFGFRSKSVVRPDVSLHGYLDKRLPYSRAFSSEARLPPNAAKMIGNMLLVIGCGVATYYCFPQPQKLPQPQEEEHVLTNWSGTHEAKTNVYIQPESLEQLEAAVSLAHEKKQKLRPVGSGLSPNGIGLCDEGMINLALMDKILAIDSDTKRVTVQAGARVEQVVEALRPHGLTLQNFASIKQQQIGGFTQVGAHGTGASLPPVDEQVVSLKLVTPAKGTIELSAEKDPDLFYLARCSLGMLGVVAEVTLQCIPLQRLLEHTFVTTKKEVRRRHKSWLQENQHLRYMWIPDTDSVVVVKCNPILEGNQPPNFKSKYTEEDRLDPVRSFYKQCALDYRAGEEGKLSDRVKDDSTSIVDVLSDDELSALSFTELRDKLLAMDPLNREHVKQVNKAEAEYWKRCEGYRVGSSDEILGFDCGGQQWVSEVCFPAGSFKRPNNNDLTYMEKLMDLIKKNDIPAPAPIEQRWTARSRSPLSPAYSPSDAIFSWVGIIMYLPTEDEEQRKAITNQFMDYRRAAQRQLWDGYGAYEHWAKIEVDADDDEGRQWLQKRLSKRFPIEVLDKARKELDPHGILSNDAVNKIFPFSQVESI